MRPWQGEANMHEVRETLLELCQKGELVSQAGLFVLPGRESLVPLRHERMRDSVKKIKRLNRVVAYFRHVPFVRAVFVCNTLAWAHTRPESDVDLLVVVRHGHLWSARFFATLPLALLRLRPGEVKESPVCLSFFLSDTALHLGSIRLPDGDPYLWYWVHSLLPVFDPDGLGSSMDLSVSSQTLTESSFIERCFERLESFLLPSEVKFAANTNTRVILSPDMLKFHTNDRRREFREVHRALCAELHLPPFPYETI
jgi:hypothetical protein